MIRQADAVPIRHLPCRDWLYLNPFRSLGVVLGPIFPRVGKIGYYSGKFSCKPSLLSTTRRLIHLSRSVSVYEKYGSTCLSSIKLWNSQVYYWLSDAETLKNITSDRQTFQKDVDAVSALRSISLHSKHLYKCYFEYEPLNIFGANIFGTEGADWKRYRAVAKPAFDEVKEIN